MADEGTINERVHHEEVSICAALLIATYAGAQSYNNEPTSAAGRVTDYSAGTSITLDDGTGSPVRFALSERVQIIGPDGKVMAPNRVEKNALIRAHLTQEGVRTVVDQIILETAPR